LLDGKAMSKANPYKAFVARYLARGAVGISVGLAAVSPLSAASLPAAASEQGRTGPSSFADRLSTIRAAVSETIKQAQQEQAQVLPHPPPPPPKPFTNFGKAPFKDTWKNFSKAPPPKE
jgi:hypothetical protein